jgi:curved DNA-binding protein CbpA
MSDLYSLLGLSRHANSEEIRAAYRAQAKQAHPDVNAGAEEADERIKDINRAYQTLGDPEARAAYDLELARQRATSRRSFWSAAATGAATFFLITGLVLVTAMWRQHANVFQSLGGDPQLPINGERQAAIAPPQDRADLSGRPENSKGGAASDEPESASPTGAFVQPPVSSHPEMSDTPGRDGEAQKRSEPPPPPMLEQTQKEQVTSASWSEQENPPRSPEAGLPAIDREAPHQQYSSAPGSDDTKKTSSTAKGGRTMAKKRAGPPSRSKHVLAMHSRGSPLSGYEVSGCTFYALVDGKTVQRCPSPGSPGNKPFWYNDDAFLGGYGGGRQ